MSESQPTPEQISDFEKQLDNSLKNEEKELMRIDKELSRNFGILKRKFLAEVRKERNDNLFTPEKEEKYSADLKITNEELKSIFKEIQKAHKALLERNDINYFYEFKNFLSINEDIPIEYSSGLKKVEIFGVKLDFPLPLGLTENVRKNYKQIIDQINKREDIKPFITQDTKLIPRDGIRIEFEIFKNGKRMKYCAMPDRVLMVMADQSESYTKTIKEILSLKRKLIGLKKKYVNDLKKDVNVDAVSKEYLLRRIDWESGVDSEEPAYMMNSFRKYQIISDEINDIDRKINQLAKPLSRILLDEKTGIKIHEKEILLRKSTFIHDFIDNEGKVLKKISYSGGYKIGEEEYYPNGKKKQDKEFVTSHEIIIREFDQGGTKKRQISYYDGVMKSLGVGNTEDVFGDGGGVIIRRIYGKDGDIQNLMFDKNNKPFAVFDYMRRENPVITESQYLDMLAKNLDTQEKLHLFFELFMQYTHDDPRLKDKDFRTANIGDKKDYWQLPEETINRMKEGKMLGDCDDYAFLAKEILRRQGKTAYVMLIPEHAICIWVEKNKYGNWNAYSICTFGFDKNGNRYGMKPDPKKEKGYPDIQTAINSLMPKYDNSGLGLDKGVNYRIEDGTLEVLEISEKGKKLYIPGVPVNILLNKNFVQKFVTAQKNTDTKQYAKAINIYEDMVRDDPINANMYHKKIIDNFQLSLSAEKDFLIITYQESGKKYPKCPLYDEAIADIYFTAKDYRNAKKYFESALKKGSSDFYTYFNLAEIYKSENKNKDQMRMLEMAEVNCRNLSANDYMKLAQAFSDVGKIDKAEGIYKNLIAKYPKRTDIKIRLASLYTNFDKAEKVYMEFISKEPDNLELHEAFAWFYKRMLIYEFSKKEGYKYINNINTVFLSKYPKMERILRSMITQFEQAAEGGTQNFYIYEYLAELYGQLGKKTKIPQLLHSAINRFPQKIQLYISLADFYAKNNEKEKISKVYKMMTKTCETEDQHGFYELKKFTEILEKAGENANLVDAYGRMLANKSIPREDIPEYQKKYIEAIKKIGSKKQKIK